MCDSDFFKAYNDAYGHPAGDQALRAVADLLSESVRSGDRVYRYGGEEFLIVLPEQGVTEAAEALQRVRSGLRSLAIKHRHGVPGEQLTISAGLASSHAAQRITSTEVLAEADTALYEAKRAGRDRIALASAVPAQSPTG